MQVLKQKSCIQKQWRGRSRPMLASILTGVCYIFAGILLSVAVGMIIALVLLPFITIIEKVWKALRS